MADESAEQDIKETLAAIAAAKDRLRKSETHLAETLSESDIDKMAAKISREFARFNKLTRPEQKEILLRHVERISLTYALPASLSGAPGMLPGDGDATELGKAVADEWARKGRKTGLGVGVRCEGGLAKPLFFA